jgi:hypothetical protein
MTGDRTASGERQHDEHDDAEGDAVRHEETMERLATRRSSQAIEA